MNHQKERTYSQREFENHVAVPIIQTGSLFVFDWKNKNGSGEYAIRYYLDQEKGNLMITGDVGSSIASWGNPLTPKGVCSLLGNISYYMEKIQCSGNRYTYRQEDVDADIDALEKDLIAQGFPEEEIRTDIETIRFFYADHIITEDSLLSDEITDLFEHYDPCWYDNPQFTTIGRRIDTRIVLWVEGFRMACEQMGICKVKK